MVVVVVVVVVGVGGGAKLQVKFSVRRRAAGGMAHGLVLVGCCGLLLAALPPTPTEHTPPCADSSPACANWAKQSECNTNPG